MTSKPKIASAVEGTTSKTAHHIELCPVCKEDLVVLPKALANGVLGTAFSLRYHCLPSLRQCLTLRSSSGHCLLCFDHLLPETVPYRAALLRCAGRQARTTRALHPGRPLAAARRCGPRLQSGTPAAVATRLLISHVCVSDHADPTTAELAELSGAAYWKNQFRPLFCATQLVEYTVLDVDELAVRAPGCATAPRTFATATCALR